MQANHSPDCQSRLTAANQAPSKISPYATSWPLTPAMRVARVKSLVAPHTAARNILPPSSGKPGNKLKVATAKLICASHRPKAPTASLLGNHRVKPKKKAQRK